MKKKDTSYTQRVKLEEVVPLETPYVINIDPCGACNLTCNFCPCNTVKENSFERHKMMSLDTFKKIVDDLKQFKTKIKRIHVSGFGEPLLNKNIAQMVRYLKDANVCDEIIIITNGLLLNKNLSDSLVESGLDYLRISLNGLTTTEYKESCNVNINIDKFFDEIKYFYDVSRGKTKLGIKGTTAFLDNDEKKEKFDSLFDNISDYLIIHDIYNQWSEFELETSKDDAKVDYFNWMDKEKICTSALISMTIHSNGDISPCCIDWKLAVTYGNVNDYSVKDLWNGERLKKIRLTLLKKQKGVIPFCDNCDVRNIDDINDVADIIVDRLENYNEMEK